MKFLRIIFVILIFAVFYSILTRHLRQYNGYQQGGAYKTPSSSTEGFTTVALNTTSFPSCVARDVDAQDLLATLQTAVKGIPTADDAPMAFEELSLIVQKLVCMDADITSMGAGPYASILLPFATTHDMEPAGTFVARCLNNAVRERDIDLTIEKLHERGVVLIGTLCSNINKLAESDIMTKFNTIVDRTKKNIKQICLKEHASMDVPAGPRDPGYFTPAALYYYGEYQETAPKFHY